MTGHDSILQVVPDELHSHATAIDRLAGEVLEIGAPLARLIGPAELTASAALTAVGDGLHAALTAEHGRLEDEAATFRGVAADYRRSDDAGAAALTGQGAGPR